MRQLRALLRHRIQLVRLRTLLRNRIHAVLAGHGHGRPGGCWSGPGRAWLAALELPAASREVIEDGLALIDALQVPIDRLDWEVRQHARCDPRVKVLTQLPGVGPFTALIILAETGGITRFGSARQLASWAGLTPTVHGSDRVAHDGHISKQGPVWLRWALCEAAQTAKRHPDFAASYQAIARRRGKKIAITAIARKLLARAWHLLADATGAPAPDHQAMQPSAPRTAITSRRGRQAPGELAKPHETAMPRSMT